MQKTAAATLSSAAMVVALATVPGLLAIFFVVQDYFSYSYLSGEPFPLWRMLAFELMVCYCWAALLPLIFSFARRMRRGWGGARTARVLAAHVLAGLVFVLVHRTIVTTLGLLWFLPGAFADGIPGFVYRKILAGSFSSLIQYSLILGGYYAHGTYHRLREQMIVAARLEAQLAQAQLQALKMQLQPHFLFNTLHTVSSLMDEDVGQARRTLTRLSDLLRQTLEHVGVQEVTLRRELEFLGGYLEIEKTRFEDRLRVNFDIDPQLLDVMVPGFMLQPLVENAIRHGIMPRPEGGCIDIRARRDGSQVMIEVADNGVGAADSGGFREGLGLSSVRRRLQQLYGESHGLDIRTREGGGTLVALSVPLRIEDGDHE
ncbi:MAG: histidine kinase [Acidobacteriota bacterium]